MRCPTYSQPASCRIAACKRALPVAIPADIRAVFLKSVMTAVNDYQDCGISQDMHTSCAFGFLVLLTGQSALSV